MKKLIFIFLIPPLVSLAQPKYKITMSAGEYTQPWMDSAQHVWVTTNDPAVNGAGGSVGGYVPGIPIRLLVTPTNLQFNSIVPGLHDGLAIDVNGNIWGWGSNQYCQLGTGNTSGGSQGVELTTDVNGNPFTGIKMASAGWGLAGNDPFYVAIKQATDTAWLFGNLSGCLGGSTCVKPTPYTIPGKIIAQIVAQNSSIHATCTDGTVWALGGQDDHSQNTGTNSTPSVFTQVAGIPAIAYVVKGNSFTIYVTSTGDSAYGNGYYGDVLEGHTSIGFNPIATPILLNSYLSSILPLDTLVAAHTALMAVRRTDSTAWGWGSNEVGLVGNGQMIYWPTYVAPSTGLLTPYAWDFGMGELMAGVTQIAPGRHNFIAAFGGPLYSFYMFLEDVNGKVYGMGRDKAGGLNRGIIPANVTGGNIASAYGTSWCMRLPTEVDPVALAASGSAGQSITTSPGCSTGQLTGSPCSLGTDAPTRPNTNLHAALALTGNSAAHTIHWDNTGSTTDGSHKINERYLTQTSGTALQAGIITGDTGTIYNVANGTYTFVDTIVDQSWDTSGVSQYVTLSPSAQTGFYFSAAGSGTACTIGAPCAPSYFNTIYASEIAGDTNYLNRNDAFPIEIIANSSGSVGNPIVTKPYGTGKIPVLGGRTTLTGWANVSGNIWQVSHTGVRENILQHNDTVLTQTTYPDLAGGWNIATSITTTQITDATHVGQVIIGSKICIRSSAYTIDTAIVTNVSGSVITFSPAAAYSGGVGWKVMNITPYEYGQYQDTIGQIRIYSVGTPTGTWTIPTVDTVLTSEGAYQEWDSLRFQGGNNADIILAFQGTGFNTFKADSVTDGFDGFELRTEGNLTVKNTIMRHFNNNAVWKTNTNNYNNSFLNDTIYDCGMQPGMGKSGNVQGYSGIIAGDSGSVVKFCYIYQMGYCGVANYGSGFKVDSNNIKKVCWILEDGGWVYTWIASLGSFAQQREMIGNVCDSSGGPTASLGTTLTSLAGYGLYLDQATSDVLVSGNSLSHTTGGAIFDHGASNTFTGNTSFASQYCDMEPYESGPVITGLIIKHNIWASTANGIPSVRFITINNDLATFGVSDSNTVIGRVPAFTPYWTFTSADPGTFRTAPGWTSLLGYDVHTPFIFGYPSYLANGSGVSVTYPVGGVYVDLNGNVYWGSVTIPPYQSKILFPFSIPIKATYGSRLIVL